MENKFRGRNYGGFIKPDGSTVIKEAVTPITPSWEERFEKSKNEWYVASEMGLGINSERIKAFISQEKALSEREWYTKGLADNQKKGEAYRKGYQEGFEAGRIDMASNIVSGHTSIAGFKVVPNN